MTSAEYWKERAEATLVSNELSVLEYEKKLKQAYEATLLDITKEIEAFFAKYSKDNSIDLATVRERLDLDSLKGFKKQAEIYLREIDRLGLDPQYKQYLRDLSSKAYVSKLQEIETNIRHHIEKLTTEVTNSMAEELKRDYENSFYRNLFDVQKHAGFGVSFTALGDKQLDKAIRSRWLDNNFSDRIWNNKTSLLTTLLSQILPREFVRGSGHIQIANQVSQRLGVNLNSAIRLVRTEMNHISNQAALDAYRTSEVVKEYEFLATLDNRTSEICRELDGKVFKLSQAVTGVNLPPMHPHCRSTTIPHFPDDEISPTVTDRVARRADGETYLVGKDMTYKEWAKKYTTDAYASRVKNVK